MKKPEWSLLRTAAVFALITPIPSTVESWNLYYPIYLHFGYLSGEQVVSIIGGLVGASIGGAILGYIVGIVRNRFFR